MQFVASESKHVRDSRSPKNVVGHPVIGKMVGAPWDGTPFIINPTYTLYSEYLLGISAFKGLQQGFSQLGALHFKGFPPISPMILVVLVQLASHDNLPTKKIAVSATQMSPIIFNPKVDEYPPEFCRPRVTSAIFVDILLTRVFFYFKENLKFWHLAGKMNRFFPQFFKPFSNSHFFPRCFCFQPRATFNQTSKDIFYRKCLCHHTWVTWCFYTSAFC